MQTSGYVMLPAALEHERLLIAEREWNGRTPEGSVEDLARGMERGF